MEDYREPIYKIEPWNITEEEFLLKNNYRNETTFSLANGYIGTRGTFEEAYDFDVETGLEGNFVNGFYESEHIRYGEWNFGFPTESQSLLNLPNAKIIKLFIEDEEFSMLTGEIEDYKRVLHMKEGRITRDLIWVSPKGKKVKISISRFVSFNNKNLMEIRYKVTPLNFSGNLKFISAIDVNVENHTRKTNPLVDYGPFGKRLANDYIDSIKDELYYEGITLNSELSIACGALNKISSENFIRKNFKNYELCGVSYEFYAKENEEIILDKFIAYSTSLDMNCEKLHGFIKAILSDAEEQGYIEAEREQKEYVEEFWRTADVIIEGDDALQQGIRFNLFHLMQSAGRDGKTGMGAKGLSGEGYEGHYFWDTEMYVLPVFVYTKPDLAKKLLDYRYFTLDKARERARVLGHDKGALYPWRTINGGEASTYFPLGTAQYHINADIAYAFKLYVDVNDDFHYLKDKAAEVLCETARVWADVGSFSEYVGNKYCICAVTGPDEYNAIVDNNFYTNLMARENLRDAIWALNKIKEKDKLSYDSLVKKIDLKDEEIEYWKKIIENMYFPYDEKRGVYPLDDGFMKRKPWDDSKIPKEKRHLLYENYHPLFIFRQRMSKQADAILAMYLHSNLFSINELRRNYDFYQEVTLHHSSLSTCIFGILASQIGYDEEAYKYFSQSARMDLDDYHNNFYAGIHAANMAGTWQGIVNGFAGLRTNKGILELNPTIPKEWNAYSFKIFYKKNLLEIKISKDEIEIRLLEGENLELYVYGEKVYIENLSEIIKIPTK
ncbi:glycosyl hydrolase family 65 protein [Clostridium perfringens]|uniref:glycoside hydrolase family 65 protein n=1 Tax=Clostridium perfringens TaxID=1502 RepID=UPI00016BC4B8|nr:glycosyl hydrolase family 65 protein [Clostridium perfringens]AOY53551.1 Maltose phosphorylase / Trehalose phosphorylase [Clostridium perfringens]EDT28379.1 glycosyl hydrolase, family 65 [Clostridium perfringens CPE str. F4969]EGT0679214.1 glycoside hydrolase family 65 protein [Clostridium perfringens]MDB2043482.1 glycoside hydrolase family 65 protein [Clostridium perfringens]MDB2053426.1 glycoside hydrolase family 65 protein [Clostridium perfringens]